MLHTARVGKGLTEDKRIRILPTHIVTVVYEIGLVQIPRVVGWGVPVSVDDAGLGLPFGPKNHRAFRPSPAFAVSTDTRQELASMRTGVPPFIVATSGSCSRPG